MTSRYEELLLPEQRDRIVEKVVAALKTQGQLPSKTLNEFRDLFKAGKPIPGFKDPLRPMAYILKQHLLERLDEDSELEELIVSVWADAQPELREAVNSHFDDLDEKVFLADDIDEEFWDTQIGLLAGEHSEYEENDILLMYKVCYANANSQSVDDAEAGDSAADGSVPHEPFGIGSLDAVLESLRNTPGASPQWRDAIPRFVESVEELVKEKNQELVKVRGLTSDLNHIQSVFQSELSFFRQQPEEWDTSSLAAFLSNANGIEESESRLTDLKGALDTYRQIRERADTLAEERERRDRRHELEEVIEGVLNEIDEMSRAAAKSDEEMVAETEAGSDDGETPAPTEADSALLEEVRILREEQKSLLDGNRALHGEFAGLRADKKALAVEVAELRDQLRISEAQASNWRNAYEAGMSSDDSAAPDPIPAEIESVAQAVGLAKARYRDRFIFHPNKKSDPDYNYRRPKEIWDALEWLATTYYDVQTGKARVIDLNESIRNTCGGWEYKPNQTDITFNTYREWYTTTRKNKTYELREHLGKGTGRDANVIRIAFAWDEDLERVVVGYIGPHQRSRVS